jgi:SPP1 family predicted phage head-tail adaptor
MSDRRAPAAGQRNNLVWLYKPDGVIDDYGQPSGQYLPVEQVWADVRPVTQKEYSSSRQAEAAIDATIRLPYRGDIAATWVVIYQGTMYDIQSMAEIGYREGLDIYARARQP